MKVATILVFNKCRSLFLQI